MKKIKVIFFSPTPHFSLIDHPLEPDIDLTQVPLNYQLPEADVWTDRTVILLFYSAFGRQKLKELRELFPNVPAIFLAKNAGKEDLLEALRLGVKNFLFMPLKGKELNEAVKEAISAKPESTPNLSLLEKVRRFGQQLINLFTDLYKGKLGGQTPQYDFLEITPLSHRMLTKDLEKEGTVPDLWVTFFGAFELNLRGTKLPAISGKKNNALLAYLLYHHNKPMHREELISIFWKDTPFDAGRNSLNVAICNIRKYLYKILPGQELILLERDCYCINPDLEVLTDVEQFKKLWEKGRAIERSQGLASALGAYHKALAYYRGDLLEDMRFEEWCESYRDNLKETYLFSLNRLSAYFFQRKEYDACIAICKRMLQKDACQEDVHRKLMECYYQLGMFDLARQQLYKCEKILHKELGIKPSEQTRKLFQKIGKG